MASFETDSSVDRFIDSCINSVEQLEILLLLRIRQKLDVETITQELRTSSGSVEKRLADLIRKNLIKARDTERKKIFVYDPPTNLIETIEQLAAFYASHRVSVINLIFSKPSDALTGFSDAFRLKD